MDDGDKEIERLLSETSKPLLELFPMDGTAKQCPRCQLEFKTLLHPFCKHKHCPPREYKKTADIRRRTDNPLAYLITRMSSLRYGR
jgi:hypothetical protein